MDRHAQIDLGSDYGSIGLIKDTSTSSFFGCCIYSLDPNISLCAI